MYRNGLRISKDLSKAKNDRDKWRKRYVRLKAQFDACPVKKTREMFRKSNKDIRKEVLKMNMVLSELRRKYKEIRERGKRRVLQRVIIDGILKKYRMKSKLGVNCRQYRPKIFTCREEVNV
jgi:hypothetical protein